MHKILALFFLCLAACSLEGGTGLDAGMILASDGSTPDGSIGGRISVPQYRAEGAVLTQFTFYDRTLDTNCFPHKTTAGLRCVPGGVFLLNYGSGKRVDCWGV